jgi:hypothetical protein
MHFTPIKIGQNDTCSCEGVLFDTESFSLCESTMKEEWCPPHQRNANLFENLEESIDKCIIEVDFPSEVPITSDHIKDMVKMCFAATCVVFSTARNNIQKNAWRRKYFYIEISRQIFDLSHSLKKLYQSEVSPRRGLKSIEKFTFKRRFIKSRNTLQYGCCEL